MSTPVRNFRIEDNIWNSALSEAKKLGIPLTFVVKIALQNFAHNPVISIGEPKEVKMPKKTHDLAEKIFDLVD